MSGTKAWRPSRRRALQLQRTETAQRGESAVAAQKEALANAHVEDVAVLLLPINARRAELTARQEQLQKVRPPFKEDHIAASFSWEVRRVGVACKKQDHHILPADVRRSLSVQHGQISLCTGRPLVGVLPLSTQLAIRAAL